MEGFAEMELYTHEVKVNDSELWKKIRDYPMDESWEVYGFERRVSHACGLSICFTSEAVIEYKRFMYVMRVWQDERLIPCHVVDQVWRMHVIHTMHYEKFCLDIFGHFVPHCLSWHSGTLDGQTDQRQKVKAYTDSLISEHFAESSLEIRQNFQWPETCKYIPGETELDVKGFINGLFIAAFLYVIHAVIFLSQPSDAFLDLIKDYRFYVIFSIVFLLLSFFCKSLVSYRVLSKIYAKDCDYCDFIENKYKEIPYSNLVIFPEDKEGEKARSFVGFVAKCLFISTILARHMTEEYVKFMRLAAASEEALVPPPGLEEVWRLHLACSESYIWFCKRISGRFIHHCPLLKEGRRTIYHLPLYNDVSGPAFERQMENYKKDYDVTLRRYVENYGDVPDGEIYIYPSSYQKMTYDGHIFPSLYPSYQEIIPDVYIIKYRILHMALIGVPFCAGTSGSRWMIIEGNNEYSAIFFIYLILTFIFFWGASLFEACCFPCRRPEFPHEYQLHSEHEGV